MRRDFSSPGTQPSENSLMRTAGSRTQTEVRASSPSLVCIVLESQPESLWAPVLPQTGVETVQPVSTNPGLEPQNVLKELG